MATRQLRKLRAQQGDPPSLPAVGSGEDASEEDQAPARPPFNPFDLLSDAEDAAPAHESDEEGDQPAPPLQVASSSAGQGGSRSKKKRKKKAAGAAREREAAAEPCSKGKQPAAPQEDLDAVLAELNLAPSTARRADGAGPSSNGAEARHLLPPLLGVDPHNLRPADEMRRIFGARVVDAEDREASTGGFAGGNRRMRRLAARGRLRMRPLRKGVLIQPRDHWVPYTGELGMELAGSTPDGQPLFRYVHTPAYQAVQRAYEECQATFDPNNIAALLAHHPYHVDALLTMSDLYRSMGENETSEELLERCLYALEQSWHPLFSITAGTCRLDYAHEPNRPLFKALFRHLQNLSRRGLHATALEVGKLLVALDPGDPLGGLFALDYLALRAHQWPWLARLAGEWAGGEGGLALLPSLAFSRALAAWRAAQPAAAPAGKADGSSASQSSQPGQGDELSPEELLKQAVLLYPLAVVRLVHRLQEQGVAKDSQWAAVLGAPLFARASDGGSADLGRLVDIWVERHHLLWKVPDALAWLRAACAALIAGDPAGGEEGANWAAVRGELFPPGGSEYSHLRVADFSDAVSRLPPEELQAAMAAGGGGGAGGGDLELLAIDPAQLEGMAPEQLAQLAARMRDDLGAELRRRGLDPANVNVVVPEGAVGEEELREGNPLLMLLRSLLPWVNAGQAPDYDADEGNSAGEDEAPADRDRGAGDGGEPEDQAPGGGAHAQAGDDID